MQRLNKRPEHKAEFKNFSNGDLEIRYFDNLKDSSYRSWRLPKEVAEDLISWWEKFCGNKRVQFPIRERTKICEFNMYTEKYIDIREFDSLGRYKIIGWSLPKGAVEKLTDWHVKEK